MQARERESSYWDHFWQSGQEGCCDAGSGPAAAAAIDQVWQQAFEGLATGSRVLDLCTGNGTVLDSAKRINEQLECVGIDSAAIRPDIAAGSVEFVRASTTALPFADESVDVVTSRFGIEYTPLDDSLGELLRVLAPGGCAWLVIHANAGETAESAERQLADLDRLLDEIRIFPAAKRALELVCSAERATVKPDAETVEEGQAAYNEFYAGLKVLGESWQQSAAADAYRDTGSILQHTFQHRQAFPLDVLLDKVRETEASVRFHRQRLAALCAAAMDEQASAALVASVNETAGSTAQVRELVTDDGALVAWLVRIEKT